MELLDEITKLAYESQLPKEINGHRRNTLIHLYRSWKGALYVPEKAHPAIKWSEKNLSLIKPDAIDTPWHTIDRSKKAENQVHVQDIKAPTHFVPANGSLPVKFKARDLKRKSEDNNNSFPCHSKKQKLNHHDTHHNIVPTKKRKP